MSLLRHPWKMHLLKKEDATVRTREKSNFVMWCAGDVGKMPSMPELNDFSTGAKTMGEHNIKLDFHPSSRVKLRVSKSSVTVRVKLGKNRFKDYINAIIERFGCVRLPPIS